MKKITEEDLIRYLYKECSPKTQTAIEEAVLHDLELKGRLQVLKRTLRQLDTLQLSSPSKASLKHIISHAKASFKGK